MTDMNDKIAFIAPAPSKLSDEFYSHFLNGNFCIQRCSACDAWHHIPRERCANCGSFDLRWAACSGEAELFSWTETRTAPLPSLQEDVPFTVALVQLEEGPRLVSRLANFNNDDLAIGRKLKLKVELVDDEFALPVFEPA